MLCTEDHGYIYCKCGYSYVDFPILRFSLPNITIQLRPKDYILEEKGICYLLIKESIEDIWIFGNVFLRQYYTLFDMENMRIGVTKAKVAYDPEKNFDPMFDAGVMNDDMETMPTKEEAEGSGSELMKAIS